MLCLDRSGAEPTFYSSNDLIEPLREALADGLVLSPDLTGAGRHGAARCQVVAMVDRQVPVKAISQDGGTPIPVCRDLLEALFSGEREGFRCQCRLGRKLGVERPMGQSRLLADLRDADAV